MSVTGTAWDMLADWLPPNEHPDRPQMQLATVTGHGTPDVRTVLLTEFSPEGFWFHTDSRSRKAAQLAQNPAVALLLLWPGFTRQLSVQGLAEPAAPQEIDRAYRRRSPYLRQLAWQNTHDFAQLPYAERVARWQALGEQGELPDPPGTWTGFLVRPQRLTFWEGDPSTASRRTEFTRADGEWRSAFLAG